MSFIDRLIKNSGCSGSELNAAIAIAKNKEFQKFVFETKKIAESNDSDESKKERISAILDKLSDTTYNQCFLNIMEIVQKSKDKCSQFKDTKEQVDNIIDRLPRLNDRRELVELIISERRKSYGLKV